MKNRKPLRIPLSAGAWQVLREQQGVHPDFVFAWRGKRLCVRLPPTWGRALANADLDGFHWHDLRHTWASWHVQCGTPIAVLKEMGGWKTLSMVTHYAHLNTAQSRTAAQACAEWRG